jgi:tetratricopeptide (TPR) repeat protein
MRSLVLLALAVRIATAAPATSDRHLAADSFQAAERAFADEDYPEALRLFRLAFSEAPDDRVRFNIAVCLERLGRFREAGTEYDAAASSDALPADVRDRARTEAARVRGRLGKLQVDGDPIGAPVRVDGAELCTLPCAIAIDPGRHEIVIETHDASDRGVATIERGKLAHLELHAEVVRERRGASWLTWVGSGAALFGATGTVVFGVRTRTLHDRYIGDPTAETRDAGLQAKELTNASIAVGALGVAVAAFDVLVLGRRTHTRRLHEAH